VNAIITSTRRSLYCGLQLGVLLALFVLPLLGQRLLWYAPNPFRGVISRPQFEAYAWIIGQSDYFGLLSIFFRFGAFLALLLFLFWALERMRLDAIWNHLMNGRPLSSGAVLLTITGSTLAWVIFLLQAALLVAPEGVGVFLAWLSPGAFILTQTLTLLVLALLAGGAVYRASAMVRTHLAGQKGRAVSPHPRIWILAIGLGLGGIISLVGVAAAWRMRQWRPEMLDWGMVDLAFRYLSPAALVVLGVFASLLAGVLLGGLLHIFMPQRVDAADGLRDRLGGFLVIAALVLIIFIPVDRLVLTGEYDLGISLPRRTGLESEPGAAVTAVVMAGPGQPARIIAAGATGLSAADQSRLQRFLDKQKHPTALTLPAIDLLMAERLRMWDGDGALALAWQSAETGLDTALELLVFEEVLEMVQPKPSLQPYLFALDNHQRFIHAGFTPILKMGSLFLRYGLPDKAEEWFEHSREWGASPREVEEAIRRATPVIDNGLIAGRLLVDGKPAVGLRVRLFRSDSYRGSTRPSLALQRNLLAEAARSIRRSQGAVVPRPDRSDTNAWLLAGSIPYALEVTDSRGGFAFSNLDVGMYAIAVLLPGDHPQFSITGAPDVITLSPSEPVRDEIEIHLNRKMQ